MTEGTALATNASKPSDTIAALIAERARYEHWLGALDGRQATAPVSVYARVRADYAARLAGVLERIGSRTVELRETADKLTGAVAALEAEQTAKREERAEAELRAAVGEFTPERWEAISRATDADIARLDARRADVGAELSRVQELLAAAAPAPVAAAAPRGAAAPASAPEPAFVAPAAPAAPAHAGMMGALAGPPRRRPATTGAAQAATAPGGVSVFLRDVPGQPVKSLKCAECGTMNVPTEWYCERCGGELAAM